jgi:hypothetical protein
MARAWATEGVPTPRNCSNRSPFPCTSIDPPDEQSRGDACASHVSQTVVFEVDAFVSLGSFLRFRESLVVSLSIRDAHHQRIETKVPGRPVGPEMWLVHDTRASPSSSKHDLSLPRPWQV